MSFALRYYQEDAVVALWEHFASRTDNPIIALPTGTGKSIVIAEFIRSAMSYYPATRVLKLTHVKELIDQNFRELVGLWPLAPAGIYSAGLNRKEVRPITFAGIASVVRKAALFGHIDIVLIDECHLVSPHDETSYQNFIADLQKVNPLVKVIGLTATPYRLGQGKLTDPVETSAGPRPSLFGHICYDLTGLDAFNRLVAEGYLAPLVAKRTNHDLDVSKVRTTAGEFNQADLQAMVDRDSITRAAIGEVERQASENNRRRWLVFATGIDHSDHVALELKDRGIAARSVHSKTGSTERDEAVAWFKAPDDGRVRALVNNGVFTTGFNCPEVDLIAMLRPTKSAGLWVQMLGRGTRPAPGKTNCLVLDFAGNTKRLGPVNDPVIPLRKGKKQPGDAPVKVCEACGTYNHASVRYCTHCGAEFERAVKFSDQADTTEVMRGSSPQVEVIAVDSVQYLPHFPRDKSKPTSLKVIYTCALNQYSEWICLEHPGYPGKKARDWWDERSDYTAPATVEEAMSMIDGLASPSHIRVWLNTNHPRVMAYDFSGTGFGEKPVKPEKNDGSVPF